MDPLSEAIRLHQNRNFIKAEQMYRELLSTGRTDATIHQYLADCLLQQQKVTDALDVVEKGLQLTPENNELQVLVSQLYWGTHQRQKAIEQFQKVVERNPENPETLFNLGGMYFEEKQFDNALETFERILKIQPNQGHAYFNIGLVQIEKTNYEAAIQNFSEGLKHLPNDSFGNKQLGMALHVSGQIEKAAEAYQKALENAVQDADKIECMTLLGNANRDLNKPEVAQKYYQDVLAMDPENEIAKRNLKTIANRTIPAWHFSMLADVSRNDAYDKAISAAVKPGDNVLDIGTGSGLLSMMAARAGADKVTAVEMVPELAAVARLVIADNNYNDVITVHEKRSTALVVGETLPERANVVVSEILDAGLLGEGVIPSLRHAWSNLLTKDAVCIPKAADVYAVLVQSDSYHRVNPVGEIQGFDLSAFNHFREEKSYIINHSGQVETEFLSDVFPVLSVDFYHLPKVATPENPNRTNFDVKVTKAGKVHGVMFWFTLHLDDTIQMSSGPGGELVHWGQAVQMFDEEKAVEIGDVVKISALQSEAIITFEQE